MNVQIDDHAKERAEERGATEEEIIDTLKTGSSVQAKASRSSKEKSYSFNNTWNGKFYKEKQVKVIYVQENDLYIVITVVVKYGNFTNLIS